VSALQTKLNFDLGSAHGGVDDWSRGDVLSLMLARKRLRPEPAEPAAPRAHVIEDPQADALERVAELFSISLEYELPDRPFAMVALRDRCVPRTDEGEALVRALVRVGFARDVGYSSVIRFELTAIGTALVEGVKGGPAPW
jgi:hypothetical protein